MKRLKNNEGSILALVTIIIGVLAILGTSMIGVAMSNFKMKMASSNMKTSLYLTEAGFEETYAKIYNIVGNSMNNANKEANVKLKEYDDILFQDTVFKVENKEKNIGDLDILFLLKNGDKYLYDEDYIKKEVEKVFAKTYQENVVMEMKKLIQNDGKIISSINSDIDVRALSDLTFASNEMKVELSSKYETNGMKKNASTILYIKTPVYNEPYTVSVTTVELPVNPLWTKVVSSDANMYINAPTEIDGEVFVNKNIAIGDNSGTTKFNKNVSTMGDIDVGSNTTVELADSYVNNVNLKGENINFSTKLSTGLYIKDDLLMDNIKQNIILNGNYYGFSDGSKSLNNTPDKSSAITINSPDINTGGSSFTANGDLNIFGTSYIAGIYQTGESISVKGNYVAYTSVLKKPTHEPEHDKYLSTNVIHDIIEGTYLMLVDSFRDGTQFGVMDKNRYFYYYYLENKESADKGGLKLENIEIKGNVKSLGNTISKKTVKIGKGESLIEDYEQFKNMEKKHELMTKYLGDDTINHVDNAVSYINVAKDCDFSGVSFDQIKGGIHYIYNTDSSKTIEIPLNSNSTYYGFIVTNSDVRITGSGNFSGSIVSLKDVHIDNPSQSKILKYNEYVVLRGLSQFEQLNSAFKKYKRHKLKHYSTEIYGNDIPYGAIVNVDYSQLLEFKNWKIGN